VFLCVCWCVCGVGWVGGGAYGPESPERRVVLPAGAWSRGGSQEVEGPHGLKAAKARRACGGPRPAKKGFRFQGIYDGNFCILTHQQPPGLAW
jgi:hypothetical protein